MPLHYAAQNGHASVVTLLLERGANIEAKDRVRMRHAAAHGLAHFTARGGGGAAAAAAAGAALATGCVWCPFGSVCLRPRHLVRRALQR